MCNLVQDALEIVEGQQSTGASLVGKRIAVLWPEERQFFPGTVIGFEPDEVSCMHLNGASATMHAMFALMHICTWHPNGSFILCFASASVQ